MLHTPYLDSRIGLLASGQFYTFANGYDKSETVGTLTEVEAALGLRTVAPAHQAKITRSWKVTMRFAYPAWDEVEGIVYADIVADRKSGAVKQARTQAEIDGHACSGRGRYWFTAEDQI